MAIPRPTRAAIGVVMSRLWSLWIRALAKLRAKALYRFQHLTRWGAYLPLSILFFSYVWWVFLPVLPGYSIAALAFAAVVMTARSDRFSQTERAMWVILGAIFMIAETRVLYLDRANADKERAAANTIQENQFETTVGGLRAAINNGHQQFKATMEKSNTIFGEVQSNLDAVTGGKTFAEFGVVPNMGSGNPVTYPMTALINGKYPIRSLAAEIEKAEPQMDNASILREMQSMHTLPITGDILPGAHMINERLGVGKYSIGIWSANGVYSEELELRLDDRGQLQQSYEVKKDGKTVARVKDGQLVFRQRPK